jgi:hypothetical protein
MRFTDTAQVPHMPTRQEQRNERDGSWSRWIAKSASSTVILASTETSKTSGRRAVPDGLDREIVKNLVVTIVISKRNQSKTGNHVSYDISYYLSFVIGHLLFVISKKLAIP